MKPTLTIALIWLSAAGLVAAELPQPPAAPAGPATAAAALRQAGPRIRFATPLFDFGKVDAGAVVKHDFIFTNTGDATLEILDVKPGCGCTTTGTWDKRVEPGKTGAVPIVFNSAGFSGQVAKSVAVTCNDVTQSNLFLQIKGTLWRPVDITPLSAYFNVPSETPTNDTRVVRIVNNLEQPLTLSEPECTNRAFRVELQTVKPGKEFDLRVTVQPPFPGSYTQAAITLKTSVTNPAVLSIPAFASLQPAVMAIPSQIHLPAGPLPASTKPSVTIRNFGTNTLAVSEAKINLEGAAVELKEVQPGRVFTVAVNFPAGLQLAPTQKVELQVKSSHPGFPVIIVPVFQLQRQPVTVSQSAVVK